MTVLDDFRDNFSLPYAESKGENSLLEALKGYYLQSGIADLEIENIQVTSGASEAILWAFSIAVNFGEEIIILDPFYSNYKAFALQTGTQLIHVPTLIENDFHLPSKEEIQKKISSRTRAICLCNPNNPTGAVMSKEEMETIIEIAQQPDLWLIVDETYRELVYDGRKPTSFLQVSEYKGIVIIESLSKTFSLCGVYRNSSQVFSGEAGGWILRSTNWGKID
jgi:aspartate aminotransferase